MKQPGRTSGFEQFRRERKMRQAQSGQIQRPIAKGQEVLREIEEQERKEVQQQRLTQDVHDFFADATRTAAQIVQKVSEDHAEQSDHKVTHEVEEFLKDAIRRAQAFMQVLQFYSGPEAERIMPAQMKNLVGPMLDSFRNEGTAQLDDKHIGLDPFAVSLDEVAKSAAEVAPETAAPSDQELLEDHLVAELAEPEPDPEPTPAATARPSSMQNPLVAAMLGDPDKLKEGLKALVRAGVLTKDQALEIWRTQGRA